MQLWRIACGILDAHLRERLLKTTYPSLDKCVYITRAAEIKKKQGISVLDGNATASCHAEKVNKVTKGKPYVKDRC